MMELKEAYLDEIVFGFNYEEISLIFTILDNDNILKGSAFDNTLENMRIKLEDILHKGKVKYKARGGR